MEAAIALADFPHRLIEAPHLLLQALEAFGFILRRQEPVIRGQVVPEGTLIAFRARKER